MNLTRTPCVALAALCLAVVTLATAAPDYGPNYRSPVYLHKVSVSSALVARQMQDDGARLVADYGTQYVLEADETAIQSGRRCGDVEVRDDYNVVMLNAGPIDTTTPEGKSLRKAAGDFTAKRLHLIQFAGPVQSKWFEALTATGVQVITYIPSNTYLVYGDDGSLKQLAALATSPELVQWDAPYADAYKLDPSVKPVDAMGKPQALPTDTFTVTLVMDAVANAQTMQLIDRIKLGDVRSRWTVDAYEFVVVRFPAGEVDAVAAQPDVVAIHPYIEPKPLCERQSTILAGRLAGNIPIDATHLTWLDSKGFTQIQFRQSAFAVDVTDDPIDNGTLTPNHFGLFTLGDTTLPSRIMYSKLELPYGAFPSGPDCAGHGTIDGHIIGGYSANPIGYPFTDYAGYHYGLGVCPYVYLGSSAIFFPGYTDPVIPNMVGRSYTYGARISSNSWGNVNPAFGGVYESTCITYDRLVRDSSTTSSGNQEMVVVFANGNNGPNYGTVSPVATAKNVLSVGAAENVQPYGGSDGSGVGDSGSDSANDIIDFSSRGPCLDGRNKPDVAAPGTHVSGGAPQDPNPGSLGTAGACFDGSGVSGGVGSNFWPAGQEWYTACSGTSQACPGAAGACALLRQWFLNHNWTPPTAAMTKAYLMNSARYMTGVSCNDSLWSHHQGMGMVNLGTGFDNVARILRDQQTNEKLNATGQFRSVVGNIADPGKPVRVTVAWTDAPGAPSGAAYRNNLDLTVWADGQSYKGNTFRGQYSYVGGSFDTRNNAESVFLPAGISGRVIASVRGTSINSDGVPGNAEPLDQDFALVVYNAMETTGPAIVANGTSIVAEGCSPSNSAVDVGESVTLNFDLVNLGNASATTVVATLLPTGGVTNPSGPQVYGAMVPGASSINRPFSFTGLAMCGGVIKATLQLSDDNTTDLGTAVFTIRVGMPGLEKTYSYAGAAVPIPDSNGSGVNLPINVSGVNGSIAKVRFSFDGTSCDVLPGSPVGVEHTFVGDLVVKLISPAGTVATLMDRPGYGPAGAAGRNFCKTMLDDDSPGAWIDSIVSTGNTLPPLGPPYTGSFVPQTPLSKFNGENPNGVWYLNVADVLGGNTGSVKAFSVHVTETDCCGGPLANMAISKQDTPDPVSLGGTITYVLTATNAGPQDAPGVVVTDYLPSNATFVGATASQGSVSAHGSVVTANMGTVANGASAVVTISATANAGPTVTNVARVSSIAIDPDPSDNIATATTSLSSADLSGVWSGVSYTCRGTGTRQQCTIKGTFTVKNVGNQNAGASTLRVYLSDNKYFEPTDTLIKEYAISALNAGASARRGSTVSYRLPKGAPVRPRWLIAVVDVNKAVPEVNETNNAVDYGPLYP
jgi:uncharacterized repeat protein (TIGR01451 family)